MESLEKRLKASNEAKARLAKDKKSIAAKNARTEGQWERPKVSRSNLFFYELLMDGRTRVWQRNTMFLRSSHDIASCFCVTVPPAGKPTHGGPQQRKPR